MDVMIAAADATIKHRQTTTRQRTESLGWRDLKDVPWDGTTFEIRRDGATFDD
jgi:hypothetical protein